MSAVRPPTDAEVLARSLDAPEAFTLIYDRYIGDLHGYLAARVGTRQADELAPATFRRAFERRRRYDPGKASVREWLYGLANRREQPSDRPVRPPTREVVVLGRNRLRELIATPRRPSPSWRGSALIGLTGVAAIVGVIVLATHQAQPVVSPRDLPDLTTPAVQFCVTAVEAKACVGPLPAVVSRPSSRCGEVRPCTTPTPQPARPPRSLPGRIPS